MSAAILTIPGAISAQTVPTIDTEDAELGGMKVGSGRLHPVIGLDLRNGDFARGGYDDDAANLRRLPLHLQIGFAYELHRDATGEADAWLVGTSSNGVHAPAVHERAHPRGWYESNTLLGVVMSPAQGMKAGVAYTIKASPNGVSGTTHEASVTFAYEADKGLGVLHPSFVATIHPRGGGGVFTQVGIEPEIPLSRGETAARVSLPVRLGTGWSGFYEAGTGSLVYGSAGIGLSRPLAVGELKGRVHAEALALVRDDRLRRLGGADAETARVVPLATLGASLAY